MSRRAASVRVGASAALLALAQLFAPVLAGPAAAQDGAQSGAQRGALPPAGNGAPADAANAEAITVPSYYDPRERIALPDLSDYGRIRFLVVTDFPPFSFIDQTGRLAGFHVDLARGICEELAVLERCQVQALPFAEVESALVAGRGEAIAAGLAITAERRARYAFTRSYLRLPARFVARRGTAPAIAAPDMTAPAIAAPGTTAPSSSGAGAPPRRSPPLVGVVADTAHAAMLRDLFGWLRPVAFADAAAARQALRAGAVEAVFGDGMRLSFWLSSPDAADCCRFLAGPYLSDHYLGNGLAIATRGEARDLAMAFDHAIAAMIRKGRFEEVYLRYFPNGLY